LEQYEQYSEALEEFKKGLDVKPNNQHLLYCAGLAWYKLGNLEKAIGYNRKALAQNKKWLIAIYQNGIYNLDYWKKYNTDSSYQEAVKCFEKVGDRDSYLNAEASFNLATLYVIHSLRQGSEHDKAEDLIKGVGLLNESIAKDRKRGLQQGIERLNKVKGNVPGRYGEDLEPVRKDTSYTKMVEKWKDRFTDSRESSGD